MPSTYYDSLGFNADILLHLPFREATGTITSDVAKPHHPILLMNAPTWTTLPSGLGTLTFDGINQYAKCLAANSVDLDFMAGDYSAFGWFNWTDLGGNPSIVIARYEVDVSGWEIYVEEESGVYYLTLRHHHAGTLVNGHPRTGAFSVGWPPGTWFNFGITRVGGTITMYRNGVALVTSMSLGGMVDPETCNRDVVVGTRFTVDSNWYQGPIQGVRVWGRALSQEEFMIMYELEKRWFP